MVVPYVQGVVVVAPDVDTIVVAGVTYVIHVSTTQDEKSIKHDTMQRTKINIVTTSFQTSINIIK